MSCTCNCSISSIQTSNTPQLCSIRLINTKNYCNTGAAAACIKLFRIKASMVESSHDSSAKRMERAWLISKQPRPVSCSSCESNGHVDCKWCAGTGFFIIGDNMLCQVPSRNTSCVICAGKDNVNHQSAETVARIRKQEEAVRKAAEKKAFRKDCNDAKGQEVEAEVQPLKKQCLEQDASKPEKGISYKVVGKSVDQLIEAELEELKDKRKKRFIFLDTGCNGVVFVQMLKKDGDPSPKDIAQHMIESIALTKKHMSRFLLRVLPIEVSCYASDEEITRAIKPLIEQHFPVETQTPHKFAVLYEARANTGVDRMKIIDAVAKSVPGPHKVDLKNPEKNIVVQIARTVCLIGVVEKYKELAKYNLRQLTSSE